MLRPTHLPYPYDHIEIPPPDDAQLRTCGWTTVVTTFGAERRWTHGRRCHCPPEHPDDREDTE